MPGSLKRSPRACLACPYGFLGRCAGSGGAPLPTDAPYVIGCRDPGRRVEYFDDVSRLLARTEDPHPTPDLPPFIPETIRLKEGYRLPERPLYAVSLNTLLTAVGNVRFGGAPRRMRRALGLREDARLMLLGTGDDARLETFWVRAERESLWDQLRDFDFEVATTFTFSVWEDDPRFDQIYNQDRNLATFEILSAWDVPTIPFLFTAAPEDVDAALDWLDERPEVGVVAVLARYYRRRALFEELLEATADLLEEVERPMRVLVVGTSSPWKLRRARARLAEHRLSFVTCQPVYRAMMGKRADSALRFTDGRDLVKGKIPHEQLFEPNIVHFEHTVG